MRRGLFPAYAFEEDIEVQLPAPPSRNVLARNVEDLYKIHTEEPHTTTLDDANVNAPLPDDGFDMRDRNLSQKYLQDESPASRNYKTRNLELAEAVRSLSKSGEDAIQPILAKCYSECLKYNTHNFSNNADEYKANLFRAKPAVLTLYNGSKVDEIKRAESLYDALNKTAEIFVEDNPHNSDLDKMGALIAYVKHCPFATLALMTDDNTVQRQLSLDTRNYDESKIDDALERLSVVSRSNPSMFKAMMPMNNISPVNKQQEEDFVRLFNRVLDKSPTESELNKVRHIFGQKGTKLVNDFLSNERLAMNAIYEYGRGDKPLTASLNAAIEESRDIPDIAPRGDGIPAVQPDRNRQRRLEEREAPRAAAPVPAPDFGGPEDVPPRRRAAAPAFPRPVVNRALEEEMARRAAMSAPVPTPDFGGPEDVPPRRRAAAPAVRPDKNRMTGHEDVPPRRRDVVAIPPPRPDFAGPKGINARNVFTPKIPAPEMPVMPNINRPDFAALKPEADEAFVKHDEASAEAIDDRFEVMPRITPKGIEMPQIDKQVMLFDAKAPVAPMPPNTKSLGSKIDELIANNVEKKEVERQKPLEKDDAVRVENDLHRCEKKTQAKVLNARKRHINNHFRVAASQAQSKSAKRALLNEKQILEKEALEQKQAAVKASMEDKHISMREVVGSKAEPAIQKEAQIEASIAAEERKALDKAHKQEAIALEQVISKQELPEKEPANAPVVSLMANPRDKRASLFAIDDNSPNIIADEKPSVKSAEAAIVAKKQVAKAENKAQAAVKADIKADAMQGAPLAAVRAKREMGKQLQVAAANKKHAIVNRLQENRKQDVLADAVKAAVEQEPAIVQLEKEVALNDLALEGNVNAEAQIEDNNALIQDFQAQDEVPDEIVIDIVMQDPEADIVNYEEAVQEAEILLDEEPEVELVIADEATALAELIESLRNCEVRWNQLSPEDQMLVSDSVDERDFVLFQGDSFCPENFATTGQEVFDREEPAPEVEAPIALPEVKKKRSPARTIATTAATAGLAYGLLKAFKVI